MRQISVGRKMGRIGVTPIRIMLPFLSDLYHFSCTWANGEILEIIPILPKSKIRVLTVSNFNFNSTSMFETMSLTSLTISYCDLSKLCQLFEYIPMLKYLKIQHFCDSQITADQLNFTNANVAHLKQLIINYSEAKFQILELLLKRIPNLKVFFISARCEMETVDADRWQHLIETFLLHLHIFKFEFAYIARDSSDEKLIKLRKFQTDFWHKQHHWYTDYEIDEYSASVYTIPYIHIGYGLKSTTKRYMNSLMSKSNGFDNVKNLCLDPRAIRNDSSYYFRNVQSLTLTYQWDLDDEDETDEYSLSTTKIKFLNMIVNVSSIKHLRIEDRCNISSSLLSKIVKRIPNVSSLAIKKRTLISFLTNRELCKCLNKKISRLDISTYYRHRYIKSNQIDLLCKTFSNLEQLECYIKNVDDLLLILGKCSKLSMVSLRMISKDIYSWIQMNASTLSVYIDFQVIDYTNE